MQHKGGNCVVVVVVVVVVIVGRTCVMLWYCIFSHRINLLWGDILFVA